MLSSGLNYKNLVIENVAAQRYAEFYILKLLMRPREINGTATQNLRASITAL